MDMLNTTTTTALIAHLMSKQWKQAELMTKEDIRKRRLEGKRIHEVFTMLDDGR
jgi:hypothetical protein